MQATGVVKEIALAHIEASAQTDSAHLTHYAGFTVGHERQNDVVSWFYIGDLRAYPFHDSGALMAERDRRRVIDSAVHYRQVGMAYATGSHPQQDFVIFGIVQC